MNKLFAASVILSFVLSAKAQDKQPQDFRMNSGQVVHGFVLTLTDSHVQLRASIFGDEVTLTRMLSEFTNSSRLAIAATQVPLDSYDGQFQLAKLAMTLGDVADAGTHARLAVKSVAGKADQAAKVLAVKQWAAAALVAQFNKEVAENHPLTAHDYLAILSTKFMDEVSPEDLVKMAERLHSAPDRQLTTPSATNSNGLTQQENDHLNKELLSADQKFRDGLKLARNTVAAVKEYDASVQLYKHCWKELQSMLTKYAANPAALTALHNFSQHIVEGATNAALQAANALTMQSDYLGAMGWVNKILQFDPNNAQALAMQGTITGAQSNASGNNGWGWGGRGAGQYRR